MCALCGDFAVIEHNDLVGILDGGTLVSDHNDSLAISAILTAFHFLPQTNSMTHNTKQYSSCAAALNELALTASDARNTTNFVRGSKRTNALRSSP